MKKSKYLSLLAVSLLLVGCGVSSSSSENGPSNTSEEPATSEEQGLTQATIDAKLGDANKLKALLSSYLEEGVSELVVSSEAYGEVATTTCSFKSKEILINIETVDSDDVLTTSGSYSGIVGDMKYYIGLGEWGNMMNEKLYASEEDIPEGTWGAMTVAQAEEEMANTIANHTNLSESLWSSFFTENTSEDESINNGVVYDSYSASLSGEVVQVRSKAHQIEYDNSNTFAGYYDFTFVAEFDANFVATSGTLTIDYYLAENCDAETQLPLEGAETYMYGSSVESLISLTLGGVEETGNEPMIDIEPYFVSSLTEDAYISTVLNLDQAPWQVESKKNEVFANVLLSDYDIISYENDPDTWEEIKYYEPQTALDAGNLTILSSSNTEAIYYYEDLENYQEGWYVSPEHVGTKVSLSIGNSRGDVVGALEVTIVAAPEIEQPSTLPQFDFESGVMVTGPNDTYDADKGITLGSLEETWFAIPTYNEGPFDSSLTERYIPKLGDSSIADVTIDMQKAIDNNFNKGIFIKVTPKTAGSTTFSIFDTKTEEYIYSCGLNIVAPVS